MTGDPPLVPTVKTGNGHHLYGRHPGGTLKNFVKHHPGLDGRADGGYVVAPPSRHASGHEYRWTAALETPLPDLPPQLLSLFSSSEVSNDPAIATRKGGYCRGSIDVRADINSSPRSSRVEGLRRKGSRRGVQPYRCSLRRAAGGRAKCCWPQDRPLRRCAPPRLLKGVGCLD